MGAAAAHKAILPRENAMTGEANREAASKNLRHQLGQGGLLSNRAGISDAKRGTVATASGSLLQRRVNGVFAMGRHMVMSDEAGTPGTQRCANSGRTGDQRAPNSAAEVVVTSTRVPLDVGDNGDELILRDSPHQPIPPCRIDAFHNAVILWRARQRRRASRE